ncbi:MAG: hypothetical protein M1820_008415 [Bogoriella megaspora]|nr:MAG: hypothetical protein M1820_008415 [Bogoriella megaspora]
MEYIVLLSAVRQQRTEAMRPLHEDDTVRPLTHQVLEWPVLLKNRILEYEVGCGPACDVHLGKAFMVKEICFVAVAKVKSPGVSTLIFGHHLSVVANAWIRKIDSSSSEPGHEDDFSNFRGIIYLSMSIRSVVGLRTLVVWERNVYTYTKNNWQNPKKGNRVLNGTKISMSTSEKLETVEMASATGSG